MDMRLTIMDFFLGLALGIVLAIVAVGVGGYFFLRDTTPATIPPVVPLSTKLPAMVVTMTETFLNQQLGETIAAPAAPAPTRALFQIEMKDAAFDVQPERRAQITANIVVTAGPLKLPLRPVTALAFEPHVGRIGIFVIKVQLQGVTIPRVWVDDFVKGMVAAAEAKMNGSLDQIQRDTHIALYDLETTEDLLILKFSSQ